MKRRQRFLLQLAIPLAALLLVAGAAGFHWGRSGPRPLPSFHDLRVNHPADYRSLVDSRCPVVKELADELATPERAYAFVRDHIRYTPMAAAARPRETLQAGQGSCLGKAALLASLYRCMGVPADSVRVMTGTVALGEEEAQHAWVDLEYQGRCIQQDPSTFLGVFGFADFPGSAFSDFFVTEEHLVFNDKGLALVSQLNRMPEFPPATP